MPIKAQIIKDSINSKTNDRLTTFIITYPRFVHAEFMTHRVLSKNSASTRAIPTAKIIQAIKDDPAMPVFWGKNQAGMQANEELDNRNQALYEGDTFIKDKDLYCEGSGNKFFYYLSNRQYAKYLWLKARDVAIGFVESLIKLGLHKQIAGRILEPWFNITVLVSGTEWENFFALRAHADAQPEIRALAEVMLEEYNKSIPEIKIPKYKNLDEINQELYEEAEYQGDHDIIEDGIYHKVDWHVPFEDQMPEGLSMFDKLRVAIARCARLSYLTFDGEMNVEKDFAIYDKLLNSNPKHASPAEHVAFPIEESKFVGNYRGWVQFRKLLPNESQRDERVIKRKVVDGKVQ